MSLWADAKIKELIARVDALEQSQTAKLCTCETPEIGLAELTAQYAEKFGKPPHHFMKAKSIAEALK